MLLLQRVSNEAEYIQNGSERVTSCVIVSVLWSLVSDALLPAETATLLGSHCDTECTDNNEQKHPVSGSFASGSTASMRAGRGEWPYMLKLNQLSTVGCRMGPEAVLQENAGPTWYHLTVPTECIHLIVKLHSMEHCLPLVGELLQKTTSISIPV